MKSIIIEKITNRITTGASFYWNSRSLSFSYIDKIIYEWEKIRPFRDKAFDNLTNFLKKENEILFLYTKWFWWDILRVFKSRDWDIRIEEDTWFIIYNWEVYVWKINELEKTNNWNWLFWSATEWKTKYEIILDKKITLPKITVHIKDKYKTKEWEFIFDNIKKDYILNS